MLHSNNKRDLLSSMARYYFVNTRLSNPNLVINWIVVDTLFFILPTKEVECNWYLFLFQLVKRSQTRCSC
jgi:hypothetical protein